MKTSTSIVMTQASSDAQLNTNFHVSGVLKGGWTMSGSTVKLQITCPDGSIAYPTQGSSTTTNLLGKFSMDYAPKVAGTYMFTATYAGNSKYSGSSASATVNVLPGAQKTMVPSVLTLSLAASTVEVGTGVVATAVLRTNASAGATPIAGAAISMKVIGSDGSTSSPVQGAQTVTDANGAIVVNYDPSMSGSYQLQVTYAGDALHGPSSASIGFSATAPAPRSTSVEAKILVYSSGSTYYAKSVSTGATISSSSNLNTVMTAAFNALTPGRTDKEKVLMQGDFKLGKAIELPSYTILQLNGTATLTAGPYASLVYTTGKTNVEVAGGYWNSGSTATDPVIYFDGCTDVIVHDCQTTDTGGNGGIGIGDCERVVITNNNIHDVSHHGIVVGNDAADIEISYNTITDTQQGGIYIIQADDGIAETAQRIWIHHNTLTRIWQDGIALYTDGSEDTVINSVVENNTLIDAADNGHNAMIAIQGGWIDPATGVYQGPVNDCIIRYNVFRDTGAFSNGCGDMLTVGGQRNQVYGNEFFNSTKPAIQLINFNNGICENNLVDTTRLDWARGILLSGSSHNTVRNNHILNSGGAGIEVVFDAYYSGSSYNVISGNIIESPRNNNCCVSISAPGVLADGTKAVQTGNQIINNTFVHPSAASPSGIYNGGTGTVVSGNTVR